jgi:hypothetical protein
MRLYASDIRMILRTRCCRCLQAGTSYPTPEGWELQAILNVTAQYAGQPAAVPVGAVLTPAAKTKGKQLVVVLRGAAFNGDGVYSELLLLLLPPPLLPKMPCSQFFQSMLCTSTSLGPWEPPDGLSYYASSTMHPLRGRVALGLS